MVHTKIQEIETRLDELKHAQKEVRDNQVNFEVERKRFVERIEKDEHNMRDIVDDQHNAKTFFQQAIQQQQEFLDEQHSQMEKDKQLYDIQVRKLQKEIDQARRDYEEILRNQTAAPEEIHRTRSIYDGLRFALAKLIFKGLSKIIGVPLPFI